MEARIITNRQQWNEFVAGSEQCNVTQSYEWGQLLTTLDGEVFYVGVVDEGGKMCAAMLLLVSHVAVSNSVYFYAPRGPIIDDPDSPAMTVLLNYVKALAHKHHAFMLKIEPGVADNDPKWLSALHRRGFVANPEALHLRHEWVLNIRLDEQNLLADMKKTWRYCVRLASRKDVTVRRGESLADIDTFYRILQTTSQRDTFMIYDKSFYEKLVELYGQSQNVALFIAEYEGQALGAALLVKMGRWCWYMYGASSNEHRDRMPNHLLQWTAMRWAKEQGCWYYNFRGIPDVLEESQPMWGVYLFKSGFGGYAMRSLETHDLPYNPLLYRLYRSWLDGRGWLKDVRARRNNRQLEAEKPEKQEKQSEQVENPPKATTTQTATESKQAARPDRMERMERAEKQPKQQKQSGQPQEQKLPRQPEPSQTEQPSITLPPPTSQSPDASQPAERTRTTEEILQQIISSESNRGADLSRTIYGEAPDQPAEQLSTSPIQQDQTQVSPQLPASLIQSPHSGTDNSQKAWEQPEQTMHEDTLADFKAQMQPTIEQRDEVQPYLAQSNIEDPTEHIETKDEPVAIQAPPQAEIENLGEHAETRDENVPAESVKPAVQPSIDQAGQEEDQDAFNEETQKLPRIQMVQKYTGTRKSNE